MEIPDSGFGNTLQQVPSRSAWCQPIHDAHLLAGITGCDSGKILVRHFVPLEVADLTVKVEGNFLGMVVADPNQDLQSFA